LQEKHRRSKDNELRRVEGPVDFQQEWKIPTKGPETENAKAKAWRVPGSTLVLRIQVFTGRDSTHGVPPDWEICASNYDGSPLLPNDYFSGYCMPTCGNDLVEPGEQCDGRTLNAGHPCGALAHWTEQSLGDGLVWCTDCRWDFSTCTP